MLPRSQQSSLLSAGTALAAHQWKPTPNLAHFSQNCHIWGTEVNNLLCCCKSESLQCSAIVHARKTRTHSIHMVHSDCRTCSHTAFAQSQKMVTSHLLPLSVHSCLLSRSHACFAPCLSTLHTPATPPRLSTRQPNLPLYAAAICTVICRPKALVPCPELALMSVTKP